MRHVRGIIAVFVAAATLGVLLMPSAPGERAAEAAVQQPYQCPRSFAWDIFTSPHTDSTKDDKAPRNDREHDSGVNLLGITVPAPGVRANDLNDSFDTVMVSSPKHAQHFVLRRDGSYEWYPVDGYVGGDSFNYMRVAPNTGVCFARVATVTIPPLTGRPVDDTYTILNDRPFDTPLFCSFNGCGVLLNDITPGHVTSADARIFNPASGTFGFEMLGLSTATPVWGGVITVHSSGSFRFHPNAGFVGTAEFWYVPSNGFGPDQAGQGQGAHVTIVVKAAPQPAVPGPPAAVEDSFSTDEDTPINFAPNAFVLNDGDALYSRVLTQPLHGSVVEDRCDFGEFQSFKCFPQGVLEKIIYSPHPNFHGLDSFQYEAKRTVGVTLTQFDTATVKILVNPVEDAPVLVNDTFTVPRGETAVLRVLDNDFDPDELIDPSTVGLEFQPDSEAGDLSLGGDGTFLYTPDGSESPKAFSYRASTTDGQAILATSFTVNVDPNPAANDSYTTNEDTPLTRTAAQGVLENDVLGAGTLTPTTGIRTTEFGFVTVNPDGSFTYTPRANFSGTDTFVYGHNNDAATVTVTVNPVPDAPALLLNIAECPEGLICVDRPDPDGRVDLGPGDTARLRGLISDPEHGTGIIEIDWGDGEKTPRVYPCAFAEILSCPYALAQNQSWYPASLGNCGPGSCNDAIFFDFSHVYDGQPPADGLRYTITVKVTSDVENLTGTANTYATLADGDGDGDADQYDNCPSDANADQLDTDGDDVGDACDPDDDGDGVIDTSDNCPLVFNDDQANNDGDAQGDACDRDDDNDGVPDDFAIGFDNCQFVANPDQTDTDGDDEGDACDPDDDNDGVLDTADNCRVVVNSGQENNDGDAQGDVCDPDDDNDTVSDGSDNCVFAANASQANFDGDAQGDVCDPDDDNDALPDSTDACDFEVPQGGRDADANGCTDTIARLRTLVSSLNTSKGTESGLLGYLGEAQKLYDKGKIVQAENKLREFIVQVEAKRGKGLTSPQADLLIAYANNIIANI